MARVKQFLGEGLFKTVCTFFFVLVGLFVIGAYNWAFKVYRTELQTINPVMFPSFTEIDVTAFAPAMQEKYYRLWRIYDWVADGYAAPRVGGLYTRVPIIYVHGNGGSYYCARSLARFVYESNARLRQKAMRDYRSHVKRQLYYEYRTNQSLERLEEGMPIPSWLQHRVEEKIIREEVPLLGTELFSVDFLEESFAHSAPITFKEARFLNHSVHLIVGGFLSTYASILSSPPAPVFDREAVDENDTRRGDSMSRLSAATRTLLKKVEKEYSMSVCNHSSLTASEKECQQAKYLLTRFSTLERARMEVQRVQQQGIWLWAESLGGVTAILAAILAPHLYAGVVVVGTPVHYPPLFFDQASVWIYEVLDAAVLQHYPAPRDVQALQDSTVNWADLLADTRHPNEVLYDLRGLPPVELHHRVRNLTLLAINGGTLDDVVPSISGYMQRSTPRAQGTPVNRSSLGLENGYRRDLCTENLRGCGAAMDHRGLVYSLQFLQNSADSLVQAALLPNASAYFGIEVTLPSPHRGRLFPTVVETLDKHRIDEWQFESIFMSSVRDSLGGKYVKETNVRALTERRKQMCVDSHVPMEYNDLPLYDEADSGSGYYNGTKVLNILIGVTTLAPEKIFLPNIQLFHDEARETPAIDSEVHARAATVLHLPITHKYTQAVPGQTLQTAVSFAVYRRKKKRQHQTWLWPRFCMLVDSDQGLGTTRSYLQYDKIDLSNIPDFTDTHSLWQLLPSFRRGVKVHTQPGFALVRGVDSALLEPQLQVRTGDGSKIFPLVMCGSLHSFYLALRGQSSLRADEPEHQLQYFYGPFHRGLHNFTYRWKPFSTYPPQLNETYLIYTLSDNHGTRPEVQLPTYSMLQHASLFSPEYLKWLLELWPQRLLAVFSMYTGIARFAGAPAVFLFTLFTALGVIEEKICANHLQKVAVVQRSFLRRIFVAHPLLDIVLWTLMVELVTGLWASTALKVCLSTDPLPYVTEAEMEARMSIWEKITLVVLYGIPPRYRACRFSWIGMQSVPVWSAFVEQMAIIYLGYGVEIVLLALAFGYLCAVGVFTWPLRRFVLLPLLRCAPSLLALVFLLIWATPTVLLLVRPSLPLCFVDIISTCALAVPVWILPRWTRPGYDYRLVFLLICAVGSFPSHFNGLALTIRNAFVMKTPAAFMDAERYTPSRPQMIVFGILQACFAGAYASLFCILRSEETLRMADQRKRERAETSAPRPDSEIGDGYVLGDLGRRAPRVRSFVSFLNSAFILGSLWASAIAMRRPLESSASLVGNMTVLGYLTTYLLKVL
ncbi:hypothetical protein JKF63_01435 [Porcisia hertigi]|uniref:GPI inositol-deacylase n=1 Tax=Porcisia hertigi TaxID=2761500 RepID=A0A836HY26_9TRYP|nr:hypothetical protein JKF63_01435 [Porcisia hertigi]